MVICAVAWWLWPEIYEGPSDSVEGVVEAKDIRAFTPSTLSVNADVQVDVSVESKATSSEDAIVEGVNPQKDHPPSESSSPDFKAREFTVPDKYPGHNLEVFEEKKVEFLIQELKLLPADAEEVSRRYVDSVETSNQVMRNRPEEAMMKMNQIIGEYENWLKGTLGEDDFLRYSEFVDLTMRELQERYRKHYKKQNH